MVYLRFSYYTIKIQDTFTCSGTANITNGIATVTVDGLSCEVEYTITAGGIFDGELVGPRLSHGTITAGPCPLTVTTITTTTSMISKEKIIIIIFNTS